MVDERGTPVHMKLDERASLLDGWMKRVTPRARCVGAS